MTGAYKINDIAYIIESNRYIREGKIIHISGDLITFKFLDYMGAATKVKAHRLYPTEEAALTAIGKSKVKISSSHMVAILG